MLLCSQNEQLLYVKVFMNKLEKELLVLKSISDGKEAIKQRDIAKILGISLGVTNSIIKRLIDKGLLKASHISRKNIEYLVTSEGLLLLAQKSREYLKRTMKNVVVFKDALNNIIKRANDDGFSSINLIGDSDLTFLIEYCCIKHSLKFTENKEHIDNNEVFNIYSEYYAGDIISGLLLSDLMNINIEN